MGLISRVKNLLSSSEGDTPGSEDSNQITIPAGVFRSIPSGSQQVVFGELTVNGSMEISGELRVANVSVLS